MSSCPQNLERAISNEVPPTFLVFKKMILSSCEIIIHYLLFLFTLIVNTLFSGYVEGLSTSGPFLKAGSNNDRKLTHKFK